jgi:hypothetical protein
MDQPSSLKQSFNGRSAGVLACRSFKVLGSFAGKITLVLLLLSVAVTCSAQSRSKSWLNGNWEGTGYQTDTESTWTVSLRVNGDKFLIEYPSQNCGGVWRLIDLDSRTARFREILKSGTSECANNGTVTIERLNRTQVAFRYAYSGERRITASAILNRKKL